VEVMRIYLATSWKNNVTAIIVGNLLKAHGHIVYIFCDPAEPAAQISLGLRKEDRTKLWDSWNALKTHEVQEIFESDFKELKACDLVLLMTPSGKSAHMEAGYAVGAGKVLVILDHPILGEWDAMYGMANAIFRSYDLKKVIDWINAYDFKIVSDRR
jgi:nucleoside 2-deoxyribosyltransferase